MGKGMKKSIVIPVFSDSPDDLISNDTIGGPASFHSMANEKLKKSLNAITIDNDSLKVCIDSIESLVNEVSKKEDKKRGIKIDSVEVNLGINSSGSVGIIGTRVEIDLGAEITIVFKVDSGGS